MVKNQECKECNGTGEISLFDWTEGGCLVDCPYCTIATLRATIEAKNVEIARLNEPSVCQGCAEYSMELAAAEARVKHEQANVRLANNAATKHSKINLDRISELERELAEAKANAYSILIRAKWGAQETDRLRTRLESARELLRDVTDECWDYDEVIDMKPKIIKWLAENWEE